MSSKSTSPQDANGRRGGANPPEAELTGEYDGLSLPWGAFGEEADGLAAIPGYEVLGELGRGGMAFVYKARHVGLDRVVALKVLRSEQAPGEALRARFHVEARNLARLEHPNIVRVYDSGEHGGRLYLAMEYVPGGSLQAQLEPDRPWPVRAAAELVAQLADAIAYAHRNGVVHRDLKPGNVLLERADEEGVRGTKAGDVPAFLPKVADFGLSRRLEEGTAITRTGELLGTPAFMAPEQANRQTGAAGQSTDVFGLGAVLYALLTGRPPYRGTREEVLDKARRGEILPPRQLNPEVPGPLERICLRALEREPSQRPTAAELERELRAWLGRSRRWFLGAGVAGGVLLAGGVAWGLWALGRRRDPLTGELIVEVRGEGKNGLRVTEPGALPVRAGDGIHLEARLNQPGYVYLLLLESQGGVKPLYPWNLEDVVQEELTPPPERPPARVVHSPTVEGEPDNDRKVWELDGVDGLETVLLLARRTPLPWDVDLAGLIGEVPAVPLGHPLEVAVRGGDEGQSVEAINWGQHRGFQKKAKDIDDPLLRLMSRLREYFEVGRAVRFAHQGK